MLAGRDRGLHWSLSEVTDCTGAPPANCAAADSGTLLVEIPLPADWMTDAANDKKE